METILKQVYSSTIIQGDSKRWTQFRTCIWYVNDLHATARALA